MSRSTNRSGIRKTSTESVRNRLTHELASRLADSRQSQAARSGPVTSAVIRLYRAGLVKQTSPRDGPAFP